MTHTPTPWNYRLAGGNVSKTHLWNADKTFCLGWIYGDTKEQEKANADLIVKAVNCHDALIDALEQIAKFRGAKDIQAIALAALAKTKQAAVCRGKAGV